MVARRSVGLRESVVVGAIALALFIAYLPVVGRYPVPFESNAFWLGTHFNGLALRSTFLRFPGELPALAIPRTSEPVNGRDYVYTSQNSVLMLLVSLPAHALRRVVGLDDPFRFVVFGRLCMVLVSVAVFVSTYVLLRTAYGDRLRAGIVAVALTGSWALYFTADVVRWLPVTHLLVLNACLAYIKHVRTGSARWRAVVYGLLFALALFHSIAGLFALGLAAGIWVRERRVRSDAAGPVLAALLGVLILMGGTAVGGYRYGQFSGGPGAGPSGVGGYVLNFPVSLARSVMTTAGLDDFAPASHALLPTALGDLTNVLLPPVPSGAATAFNPRPSEPSMAGSSSGIAAYTRDPRGAAALYNRVMGFEPIWWSSRKFDAFSWVPVVAALGQALALAAVAWWWLGRDVTRLTPGRVGRAVLRLGRACVGIRGERQILHQLFACSVLIYLFMIFEYAAEGVFRVGALTLPLTIALAEGLARIRWTRHVQARVVAFVVMLVGMNVWYAVHTKVVEPRAHPYYRPYVALVEWARGASHGQPLYFDLPFDHLAAKMLIDGPMPYTCLEVPRIPDTARCRDFVTVYGRRTEVLVLGAARPPFDHDGLKATLRPGAVIPWGALTPEEFPTSLRRLLPERPKGDSRLRLEHVDRVRDRYERPVHDLYFYGGVVVGGTDFDA